MIKVIGVWRISLLLAVCMALASCVAGKKAKGPGAYAVEQDVPQVIAVLPASIDLAQNATEKGEINSEDGEFVGGLARSILHNHLAGKGYQPLLASAVDRKLYAYPDWKTMEPRALCKLLGTQGVVYIDVSGWAMVNVAAVENFMLSASARMVSDSGREVGTWTETAEKHKISVPTSLLGVAGTLAGALLSDSPQKQFRHVAYDWGWKMAQVMPDCLKGQTLPEIMLVDSNVDVGLFGTGEKVAVKVFAEKDLIASFDIGEFKKGIPLKMVGEGEYEGFYVVKENDQAKDQLLTVRVARANGAEREWTEAEAVVSIDGVLPLAPEKEVLQAQNDGVHIKWQLPQGEEVVAFVVERNDSPVGEFTQLIRTENAQFVDGEVEQGMTYFYRIRAVDKARNLSLPGKPQEVVMPYFSEMPVGGDLTGSLITGNYFVKQDVLVPAGEVLTVMKGARLAFAKGTGLTVRGKLVVKGTEEALVEFSGDQWLGIVVEPEGIAKIRQASFAGSDSVLNSAGKLLVENINGTGAAGQGVVVSGGLFELSDVDLTGWNQAVVVDGAEGVLTKSSLVGNKVGVTYRAGELALEHNNIYDNKQNIVAESPLAVRENYFGATIAVDARVSERVILKSVLDAPYPNGRVIALMEDEDITAEQAVKRFEEYKAQGVELFNERKYGDAYVALSKALRYKMGRDVSLYLAYTLMELGEAGRAESVMEKAIAEFPYDYRLHQVYVRHLFGMGNVSKARIVVDKALKMNPGDESLKMLKEYVDGQEVD